MTSEADLPDWRSASLGELVQHILGRHHGYLRSELPLLEEMMAKVVEAHHVRHGASLLPLRRIFQHLKQELESHIKKEEGILFPAILKLETALAAGKGAPRPPFGSFSNPVRVMEQEHQSAGWALNEMREITGDYMYPPDACETYRALFRRLEALEADMHTHIHLENNILFPRAMELERRSLCL